jgi:hypothetical protein
MKNKPVKLSLLLVAVFVLGGCSINEEISLEVLNPKGVIEPPQTLGLAPRIPDLAGKKVALIPNIKQGVANLFDVLEELLKQRYPDVTVLRYPARLLRQELAEEFQQVAEECDVFIHAIGD